MPIKGAPPSRAPRFFLPVAEVGWTLVELVVVLGVAAIIAFFAVRTWQPKEALALEQAERLRNDLRHIQMLALTWNRPLRLIAGANSYQVCCLDAAMAACLTALPLPPPAPCATPDPVFDPGRGSPFKVDLEPGLSLAGPAFALNFDTLGRPSDGAAPLVGNTDFTINGASVARTVVVAPITGFAVVQ
jgi:type II secretory pathway pseudopilin PulG